MGKNVCSAAINHGNSQSSLKALEFYSGIGGMHGAVETAYKAGHIPAVEVLAAFDNNPVANSVYEHNFGRIVRRVCTVSATWLCQLLMLTCHAACPLIGSLHCRTTLKQFLFNK